MAHPYSFLKLDVHQAKELQTFLVTMLQERRLKARIRGQAIWYSHQGWTVDKIAQHFGISKRSVWEWFKTYQQAGPEGLKGKYFCRKLGGQRK
jgi:AraC-like DNA-binding protein